MEALCAITSGATDSDCISPSRRNASGHGWLVSHALMEAKGVTTYDVTPSDCISPSKHNVYGQRRL